MMNRCELRYPGDARPFPVHVVTNWAGRGVERVTLRSRAIELLNCAGVRRREARIPRTTSGWGVAEAATFRRERLGLSRWLLASAAAHRHRAPMTVLP